MILWKIIIKQEFFHADKKGVSTNSRNIYWGGEGIYWGKNIGTLKMGKFKSWIVPEIRVLF